MARELEGRAKRARTAENEGDAAEEGSRGAKRASAAKRSGAAAASVGGGKAGAARDVDADHIDDSAAGSSAGAAAAAASNCSLEALPDELLSRVMYLAAQRDWAVKPICGGLSPLDPQDCRPDVQLHLLSKLKAVCRRFRRIAEDLDSSRWRCVGLREPNDAAVEQLLKLTEKARKAVRRIRLQGGSVSPNGHRRLFSAFQGQLTELRLLYKEQHGTGAQLSGVGALKGMDKLRKLYIGIDYSGWKWPEFRDLPFVARLPTQPLSIIKFLPNLRALELDMPLPVSVLEGLTPLAPTLRALSFKAAVYRDSHVQPISAAAAFTSLERLSLSFWSEVSGKQLHTKATAAHLQPLCALPQLRALDLACRLQWLGFLESMPGLEHASIDLEQISDADVKAMASSHALRSLAVHSRNADSQYRRTGISSRLMRTIATLPSIEAVHLDVHVKELETLAGAPLAWSNLHRLRVGVGTDEIPGAFLERLASDAPSLRVLEVESPLPVSTDLAAISSLDYLRELRITKGGGEGLGPVHRGHLRCVLKTTRVVFEDEDEGAGGAPPA
eukprot:tig00000430_g586.t1